MPLLSCNRQLALVGLQLRVINGVVSLLTTEVSNCQFQKYPLTFADISGTDNGGPKVFRSSTRFAAFGSRAARSIRHINIYSSGGGDQNEQ
jgi:hypothetical protein